LLVRHERRFLVDFFAGAAVTSRVKRVRACSAPASSETGEVSITS